MGILTADNHFSVSGLVQKVFCHKTKMTLSVYSFLCFWTQILPQNKVWYKKLFTDGTIVEFSLFGSKVGAIFKAVL